MTYALTAEMRRRVCVHEAAHAVVYAPDEYGADRAGFRRDLAQMSEAMRRETYRQIRAHVCGALAGNAAEDILRGEDP